MYSPEYDAGDYADDDSSDYEAKLEATPPHDQDAQTAEEMWGIPTASSMPRGLASDFWDEESEPSPAANNPAPPAQRSPMQHIKVHRSGTTPADAWAAEEKQLMQEAASSIAEANHAIASGRADCPSRNPERPGSNLLDLIDELEENTSAGERFEVPDT